MLCHLHLIHGCLAQHQESAYQIRASSSENNRFIPSHGPRNLPSYQVGEIYDPSKASCLRSHKAHDDICNSAGHKSMKTSIAKWIVYQTEASDDSVQVTTCNSMAVRRPLSGHVSNSNVCIPCAVGTKRQIHDTRTERKKLTAKRNSERVRPTLADRSLSNPNGGTPLMIVTPTD